jgi:GNAT superfamily N-acetyltransferase
VLSAVADILPVTEKDTAERPRLIREATQIFFETANIKVFESPSAREAFYQRWFGHYLAADPASFLLALDEYGAAIGYLAGCLDSFSEAARIIISDIPFYTPAFCSALRDHPSHVHINVKPGYQGKGVGRLLIARFFQLCRDRGSSGIHVVTGAKSPAVTFYQACGFTPFSVPDAAPDLALLVYAIPAP